MASGPVDTLVEALALLVASIAGYVTRWLHKREKPKGKPSAPRDRRT